MKLSEMNYCVDCAQDLIDAMRWMPPEIKKDIINMINYEAVEYYTAEEAEDYGAEIDQ